MHKEDRKTARERCIEAVIRNTGWSRKESVVHIDDARNRLGIKYIEYRRCRMWEVPVPDQELKYREYLEQKRIEEEEKQADAAASLSRKTAIETIIQNDYESGDKGAGKFAYAKEVLEALTVTDFSQPGKPDGISFEDVSAMIGVQFLPDLSVSRFDFAQFKKRFLEHRDTEKDKYSFMLMFTDWLFFCRDEGYDMDDYFDYALYIRSREEREQFASANFRDNLRKALNKDPAVLSNKMGFLKNFDAFIERSWIDCRSCTSEEFRRFLKDSPVIFIKKLGGSGGDGVARVDTKDQNTGELLAELKEKKCIAETAIVQHPEIAGFNSDTVNTIRIVTLYDCTGEIRIIGSAIRFGRKGCIMDNFHQGGICALVDPETGIIISDAADRNGNRYEAHPDSGKRFRGFRVPAWSEVVRKSKTAAETCKDSNRLIGWDLAVTASGRVDIIEGNSRPGFDILQVPDMTGRKAEIEKYVEGLISPEELYDTKTGYWRKKATSI